MTEKRTKRPAYPARRNPLPWRIEPCEMSDDTVLAWIEDANGGRVTEMQAIDFYAAELIVAAANRLSTAGRKEG